MPRRLALALAAALLAAACSSAAVPTDDIPLLPATDAAAMTALLASSDRPVELNVRATRCLPSRSEAPPPPRSG
ncbi:MAG: hypothetical protein MUE66_10015, partial [Acidimicrobiia bacterium]|nr:hypothetical protein [Acidimicrobiia bacterium]